MCKSINKLDNGITRIEFDWTDAQGTLKSGEYILEFATTMDCSYDRIFKISFNIDETGNVTNESTITVE